MSRQLSLFVSLVFVAPNFAEQPVEFNRDIRPILSDKCFACHGPDAEHREADLRFDTEEGAKADLGGYFAILPGKPEESEVLERITRKTKAGKMPPVKTGKKLSPREIDLMRRWIAQGAKYQPHWSFVPPKRPTLPAVKDSSWVRNDIDRFVLARIEKAGLSPSAMADKVTLLRRLYFDLIGLPPTIEEVDAFLADTRPDPYERLVERLLASPHYGERMAMYWLDLVRYANTVGYHGDQEHAIAPYRDYVIKAFKDNMPFDRFTREQLAGDLLPNPTLEQKIATGYNRVLQTSHEGGVQVKEYLSKYDADRVRNVSSVWMGATLGCAQCHDHKFDPYTQKDFYSFVAFFADIEDRRTFRGGDTTPTKREPEIQVVSPLVQERLDRLRSELTKKNLSAQQRDDLQKQIARMEKQKQRTMVTTAVAPKTIRVLHRGDWMDETGEVVLPRVPHFLEQIQTKQRPSRLDLARWLTSPKHPQTARVFANRLWYLYFGAGLTRTLQDTGSQGEWPLHLPLLDWLAVEFVESGWDVKHMVKLIVTSNAYRQTSQTTPTLVETDPENRLFARQGRFRIPAELIRDNALSLSGLLHDELGGSISRPYQPTGYYAHLNFPKRRYTSDKSIDQYRRGVYVHWQRQFLHPMLRAFDAPSREECTAQRPISNTPLAALTLLNDPTFVESARNLASRILTEGGKDTATRLRWAWRTVLSRSPSERELAVLHKVLTRNLAKYENDAASAAALTSVGLSPRRDGIDIGELAAWTQVARTLLNLNETITRN